MACNFDASLNEKEKFVDMDSRLGFHTQQQQGEDVGCAVVSSTSQQEKEGDGNIGSIITMLVADQGVDLDDIIIESSLQGQKLGIMQTDIKEEDLTGEGCFQQGAGEYNAPYLYSNNTNNDFNITNNGYYSQRPGYLVGRSQEGNDLNKDIVGRSRSLSSLSSSSEGDEEHIRQHYRNNNPYDPKTLPSDSYQIDTADSRTRNFHQREGTEYYGNNSNAYRQNMLSNSKQPNSPIEKKDDKYWERRRKNNLAAKKSRDARRVRENQLRLKVLCLENANRVLREQMDRKHLETVQLRERLSKYENVEDKNTLKM